MPGHTTNRRTLSSRTTAGSYRAPVQGIVDFDAFEKGFDSAFDIEAFDREVPEWVKLDQEIGASKFDSGTGTPATGNFEGQTENLHTDVLEQSMIDTYVKNNRTNKYLKGNEEDKERALQDLEALKDFLAKKGTVYTAIGDSNTYDLELSKNAPVLDENGEAIIYKGKNGKDVKLTWGMMNSVHGKPDAKYNRRIEQRSISKGGVDLQPVIGEVITLGEGENAKEYFINYSAINDEYIIEVKSRRIPHNKYKTLMFNYSKIEKLEGYDTTKIAIFVFNCSDGIYYWEYDESEFTIGRGGRCDRGCNEYYTMAYVEVSRLHPLTEPLTFNKEEEEEKESCCDTIKKKFNSHLQKEQ